jgi:putative protease
MIINIDKKIEIEVFIHGAVCIAYSGRCMLSNNFCFRDANIGGCAQSCRWSLKLLDGNHQLISEHFTMSAKDMCQITNVKNLIEIGVTSFKIEGRMKSEHYIATVVNDYRKTIDAYYNNIEIGDQYINDIKAAANRETSFA